MQGKTYVLKLADLSPQSRALAAKLRVQKSTTQKLVTNVVVDLDQLEYRDGLQYFEEKPFTGVAVAKYDNGQKRAEGTFKDGKQHDLWAEWYENGRKKWEWTFKDGKQHGLQTSWYENGQKESEHTCKDGKEHGLATSWYENGLKKAEFIWKDSKLVTTTVWKPNGEKCSDTNVVDGNGIVCVYHDNGQKKEEWTFKDGKVISSKEPAKELVKAPAEPVLTSAPVEGESFSIPDINLDMLWCKPGTFMMGSPEDEKNRRDNETQHEVTLTKGFYLGKYEVTQVQWEKVMGTDPSKFRGATRPVEEVNWYHAIKFCEKLTQIASLRGRVWARGPATMNKHSHNITRK